MDTKKLEINVKEIASLLNSKKKYIYIFFKNFLLFLIYFFLPIVIVLI